MAFNSANLMVTFRDPAGKFGPQGYCRSCKEPVAWFKSQTWCGVVSMKDVQQSAVYQGHTVATAVYTGAQLHGCYQQGNVDKYSRVFAQATGQTPATTTQGSALPIPPFVAPTVPQPQPLPPPPPFEPAEPVKVEPPPPREPIYPTEAMGQWNRLGTAIKAGLFRLLLWGPPGTGKTSYPNRLCKAEGWTCFNSLPLTEETDKSYLIGQWSLKGGTLEWQDGLAVEAARASKNGPTWLVLNEISHASSDCMTALFAVLDDRDLISFRLPSGEVVTPDLENWHVIATTNDEPTVLPEPIRSRFECSIELTHANPELVKSLHSIHARRLLCAASREFDIRHVIAWDRLMAKGMDLAVAARIVWDGTVAQAVIDATRMA